MDTGTDEVHRWYGVLEVKNNENQQSEICATGSNWYRGERK